MEGTKKQKMPSELEVAHYFFKMGLEVKHADAFLGYYRALSWQIMQGRPIRNWKSLAFHWVRSFKKAKPLTGKSIRHQ